MRLSRSAYESLRAEMRQELIRASRLGVHEEHRVLRRLSRLDMCFARNQEWDDFTPGDIISHAVYTSE